MAQMNRSYGSDIQNLLDVANDIKAIDGGASAFEVGKKRMQKALGEALLQSVQLVSDLHRQIKNLSCHHQFHMEF